MVILRKKSISEEDGVVEAGEKINNDAHVNGGDVWGREARRGAKDWRSCLAEALTEMPPEMAHRFLQIMPKEMLAEVLKSVEHPVVKLALMLLAK